MPFTPVSVVPLVVNTYGASSGRQQDKQSFLKALIGTRGISCHDFTVRGVRPR
nr:hypothetical protein [uncultured bacterium]